MVISTSSPSAAAWRPILRLPLAVLAVAALLTGSA
jgi:hypothetical protein